ncbi:hypothetical protein I8748_34615, partial [Nostoc sp. CENA67]
MNRDEALKHQQFNQPCYYTEDAFPKLKGKPLYIWELGETTAQVGETPPTITQTGQSLPKVWMRLRELTSTDIPMTKHEIIAA